MRMICVWAAKAAIAGTAAFVLLNALSMLWWHPPFYYPNPGGATDRIFPPHAVYAELTEGLGMGRTDKNGYVNPPELAERDHVDVLLMGSSHLEAQFLWPRETAVAVREQIPRQAAGPPGCRK